jgi:hypothetical protein
MFSETSVDTQRTIWRYIPEDGTLQHTRILRLMHFSVSRTVFEVIERKYTLHN